MSRPLDAAASVHPAGPPAQPRPSSSAMAAHLEILAVIDSFAAFARAEAKEALEAADERAVEALNAFLADLDTKKRCVIGQRTTRIGVSGTTGAGKSSLLNSLCGAAVLPVKSGQTACTSVAIDLSCTKSDQLDADVPFTVRISYMDREKWVQERARLIAASFPEDPKARDRSSLAKLKAIYTEEEMKIIRQDPNFEKVEIEEVLRLELGQRILECKTADDVQRTLEQHTTEKRRGRGPVRPALWPLICRVQVLGPFPSLPDGVTLVDLPGDNDVAERLGAEAYQQFREDCHALWIVERATDRNASSQHFSERLNAFLTNGTLQRARLILTQLDALPTDALQESLFDSELTIQDHLLQQELLLRESMIDATASNGILPQDELQRIIEDLPIHWVSAASYDTRHIAEADRSNLQRDRFCMFVNFFGDDVGVTGIPALIQAIEEIKRSHVSSQSPPSVEEIKKSLEDTRSNLSAQLARPQQSASPVAAAAAAPQSGAGVAAPSTAASKESNSPVRAASELKSQFDDLKLPDRFFYEAAKLCAPTPGDQYPELTEVRQREHKQFEEACRDDIRASVHGANGAYNTIQAMMRKDGYHGRPPLFEVATHAFLRVTGFAPLWTEFFTTVAASEIARWKLLMGNQLRQFIHTAHLAEGACDCDTFVRRFDVMYDSNAVVLLNLARNARRDSILGVMQFTAEYLRSTRLWHGYDSGKGCRDRMQAHIERVFADLLEPERKLLFTAIYGHLHRALRRQLLVHVNPWLTRVSAQASRIASQAVAGAGNPHSKGRALAYRRGLLDRIAKLLGLPVDVPDVEMCHICTIRPVSAHPAGCKHQFCDDCITAWLGQRSHQTCPVCRNRFTHVHPWLPAEADHEPCLENGCDLE